MTLIMRDVLASQLTVDEGDRLKPYTDTRGKLTIGRGHNLTDRGISQRVSDFIFAEDLDGVMADCVTLPFWNQITPISQCVVANLVFNMGLATFKTFVTFNKLMSQQKYIPAAHDLASTLWFKQVQQSRANRLCNMLITQTFDGKIASA